MGFGSNVNHARGAFWHARGRGDSGQVLVIFAIVFTVLIAAAGLLLDGGLAWGARREAQNAADMAALAAVKAKAEGTDLTTAATAMALSNGMAGGTVSCPDGSTAQGVVLNNPPSGGWVPPANLDTDPTHYIEVIVTRSLNTTFAAAIGQPCWLASGRAVARFAAETTGSPGTPWPAVLAVNTCQPKAFDNSASFTVVGGVVSNSGMADSSNGTTISGTVTYVPNPAGCGPFTAPSGKSYTPVPVTTLTQFPVSYVFDTTNRRICNETVATSSPSPGPKNLCPAPNPPAGQTLDPMSADCTYWLTSNTLGNGPWMDPLDSKHFLDGVYCRNGNIGLSLNGGKGNVTLVATGSINSSAGNANFVGYWNKLFMFTTSGGATNVVINYSGSGARWNGIFYAPNGKVQVSGGGNLTQNAALWGQTVHTSGTGWTLDGSGLGSSTGTQVTTYRAGSLVE